MDKAILLDIHRYWFGELKLPNDFRKETGKLWFRPSEETDRYICETYGRFIPEAATVNWDLGGLTREEGIGLLVLLDQFPRNIFRDSSEAFAQDPRAREIARGLIAGGIDRFFLIERTALALVFQHHEDVSDQDYSLLLAAELAVNGPDSMREFHRILLDKACKHRDLIRRFGRYPHRNAVLGRPSTPEEAAFLKEHGRGLICRRSRGARFVAVLGRMDVQHRRRLRAAGFVVMKKPPTGGSAPVKPKVEI
jgi:uncharacterized protein (DUF924 family)